MADLGRNIFSCLLRQRDVHDQGEPDHVAAVPAGWPNRDAPRRKPLRPAACKRAASCEKRCQLGAELQTATAISTSIIFNSFPLLHHHIFTAINPSIESNPDHRASLLASPPDCLHPQVRGSPPLCLLCSAQTKRTLAATAPACSSVLWVCSRHMLRSRCLLWGSNMSLGKSVALANQLDRAAARLATPVQEQTHFEPPHHHRQRSASPGPCDGCAGVSRNAAV